MGKKVHMICAKCGSDEMHFRINEPSEDCGCGVSIICEDCAELTGVEEWNEFNDRIEYIPIKE